VTGLLPDWWLPIGALFAMLAVVALVLAASIAADDGTKEQRRLVARVATFLPVICALLLAAWPLIAAVLAVWGVVRLVRFAWTESPEEKAKRLRRARRERDRHIADLEREAGIR
jgi:hypothetical protein